MIVIRGTVGILCQKVVQWLHAAYHTNVSISYDFCQSCIIFSAMPSRQSILSLKSAYAITRSSSGAEKTRETYDNGVVSEKREILREKNRPVHFVYASRQMLYHITVLTYLSYKSIAKLWGAFCRTHNRSHAVERIGFARYSSCKNIYGLPEYLECSANGKSYAISYW